MTGTHHCGSNDAGCEADPGLRCRDVAQVTHSAVFRLTSGVWKPGSCTGWQQQQRRFAHLAVVHDVAVAQQHELVQQLVQAAGRLVDGGDDGAAAAGQRAQRLHQLQRRRAVQSAAVGGRFACQRVPAS